MGTSSEVLGLDTHSDDLASPEPDQRQSIAIDQVIHEQQTLPQLGQLFASEIKNLNQVVKLQQTLQGIEKNLVGFS